MWGKVYTIMVVTDIWFWIMYLYDIMNHFNAGGSRCENGKWRKGMFLQVWNENSSFVTPFEKDAEGHFNYDKYHYYGKIVWWMIPMSKLKKSIDGKGKVGYNPINWPKQCWFKM